LAFGYACWLGMEAAHEAGHALHAVVSGGRVARVDLPAAGFSRTDVSPNPHPAFVAWGGPVWGTALPAGAWAACAACARRGGRAARVIRQGAQVFAGFCLIANGAYLGVGWVDRVGDAGDLLRYGVPIWALAAYGIIATGAGLLLWHLLGTGRPGTGRRARSGAGG